MNRPIEFRAFLGGKMVPIGALTFFTDGGILVNDEDPNPPLMQFTGLRDKNGKEIYEGDIVEDEHGAMWKVYFAEGVAAFRLESPDEQAYQDMTEGMYVSVVGNIYENPDLIKP